ncbi:translation initiation factor IF-2 [Thermodesulfobacteriota bacterium]
MAKIRIYELAKELNLESKDLVEKLIAGGVNIKNYMSTLDEKGVQRAREVVSGAISEVIEEKRIKPTVIRRRKKKVKVGEEKAAVKDVTEKTGEALAEAAPQIDEKEPEKHPGEGLTAAETAPVKGEEAPEESIGEQPVLEADEPVAVEAETAQVEVAPKKGKGRAVKAKAKRTKKKKESAPAKIIKRPEEGPLKTAIRGKKEDKREESPKSTRKTALAKGKKKTSSKKDAEIVVSPEIPVVEEVKEKSSKKKKDKKKTEKQDSGKKVKMRHRKLEVFERADLYEGRKTRRKDSKRTKKTKQETKRLKQTEITTPKAIKRRIKIQENVTVAELAKAMGIKATEFIKKLIALGVRANINQLIDFETASLVADEFDFELELDQFVIEDMIAEVKDQPKDLKPRPPVVTIMGHVDHGKTSLLDFIRESNIIGAESGGITQHIGAYYVETKGGDIVFLDTPGHEAFTAMRARGAQVTDIIVLVVAADDGVMPQTKEAINHARAADIPIVVAINKIDKPDAEPENVKRELAEAGLVPEEWSGDTIFGNISAKTGQGVNELLELILLQSEMLELKANPDKAAVGTIIEARLDKNKGPTATVLIKGGTLHQGNYFVCGENHGKIRAMFNHRGVRMPSAGPAVPVEIYGIAGVPMAGDEFQVIKDEKTSKQIVGYRQAQLRSKGASRRGIVSLEDLFDQIKEGEIKELNIILKADVQGSIEALSDALVKLSTEEVKLKIIHSSTGGITETDVMLASAGGAIIIGFNVRANLRVTDIAEQEKVDIQYYDVIYDCIKDVRMAMAGLLDPIMKENVIGRADVKEIFRVPKIGAIAGCQVSDGHVERNAHARLLRDDVVIFDGKVASLRRFKDDVKEVQSGYECGIALENFQDIKPGDVFEVYNIEETKAEL